MKGVCRFLYVAQSHFVRKCMTCLFQHKIDVGLMLFHGIRASCVGGGGLTTHPKPNRLPNQALFVHP